MRKEGLPGVANAHLDERSRYINGAVGQLGCLDVRDRHVIQARQTRTSEAKNLFSTMSRKRCAPRGAHVGCTAMFNTAPTLLLPPAALGSAAWMPSVVWQQTRVTAPGGGDTICGDGSSVGTAW